MDKNQLAADFKRRVRDNSRTRWIRFGIVSLIFFLWVAWLGNWWVALAWILLFDIYITGYIPFTWWKKSKSICPDSCVLRVHIHRAELSDTFIIT